MILDSSALVAILLREPERDAFAHAMEREKTRVGAPTLLETSLVLGPQRLRALDEIVVVAQVEVVAFSAEHLEAARSAHERFGRGTGHPARLNFGDCMSYALAKVLGEPLLFKGDDFRHTDVVAAYVP